MIDMIKELYENGFYADHQLSEEYRALCKKESDAMDKVQSVMGMDIVDEISEAQGAIADEENLDWFRRGFRLGASLMLELR